MKKLSLLLSLLLVGSMAFAAGLEDKYPGTKGVYLVKGEAQKKAINKLLEDVDVPFEMGDGYYDVVDLNLFIVRKGKVVQGYIEEYKLSYSEDPEYYMVLVRYDKKGKRVGELETTEIIPRDDD